MASNWKSHRACTPGMRAALLSVPTVRQLLNHDLMMHALLTSPHRCRNSSERLTWPSALKARFEFEAPVLQRHVDRTRVQCCNHPCTLSPCAEAIPGVSAHTHTSACLCIRITWELGKYSCPGPALTHDITVLVVVGWAWGGRCWCVFPGDSSLVPTP